MEFSLATMLKNHLLRLSVPLQSPSLALMLEQFKEAFYWTKTVLSLLFFGGLVSGRSSFCWTGLPSGYLVVSLDTREAAEVVGHKKAVHPLSAVVSRSHRWSLTGNCDLRYINLLTANCFGISVLFKYQNFTADFFIGLLLFLEPEQMMITASASTFLNLRKRSF